MIEFIYKGYTHHYYKQIKINGITQIYYSKIYRCISTLRYFGPQFLEPNLIQQL